MANVQYSSSLFKSTFVDQPMRMFVSPSWWLVFDDSSTISSVKTHAVPLLNRFNPKQSPSASSFRRNPPLGIYLHCPFPLFENGCNSCEMPWILFMRMLKHQRVLVSGCNVALLCGMQCHFSFLDNREHQNDHIEVTCLRSAYRSKVDMSSYAQGK